MISPPPREYVWYQAGGMANILSLSKLCKRFLVHFDGEAMTFTAEFPSGTLVFRQSSEVLESSLARGHAIINQRYCKARKERGFMEC